MYKHKVVFTGGNRFIIEEDAYFKQIKYFNTLEEVTAHFSDLMKQYYGKLENGHFFCIVHYKRTLLLFWHRQRTERIAWWEGRIENNLVIEIEEPP